MGGLPAALAVADLNRDGRPDVVEIDQQLRPRLQAVLAARHDRFPHDPDALGTDLRVLVETAPLPELPVEAVEAERDQLAAELERLRQG